MHMHSHLLILAAAAAACSGLTIRNKHVADFRLFGETGCDRANLGVWTVVDTDFTPGECKSLGDDSVKSVFLTDVNPGCILSLYTDEACTSGKEEIGDRQCLDAEDGWEAWAMECK